MILRTEARPAVALSADGRLLDLLRRSRRRGESLTVHSVFARAINLLSDAGRLVTLAAEGADDAPWTLRAAVADWSSILLAAGDRIRITGSTLTLPSGAPLLTDWEASEPWSAAPLVAGDGAAFDVLAQSLDDWLARHGVAGGMLGSSSSGPFEAVVHERLARGSEALSEAIIWYSKTGQEEFLGQENVLDQAILQLLGLGSGLTPAGDDHLCGLALLAARPGSRMRGLGERLLAVLDSHPARTTAVSEATLREAAEGRARQSLLELLNGMLAVAPRDGEPLEHVQAQLVRVRAIGRTSGTDILSGLSAGLHVERELRGSV
ncbi:DUF2877 domain-containing protein [Arthrobacter sp. NPDC090010]|uniref:oxamate carbamoyltransferase subunit AllH family protein n=1 Tax=Arthrobacter sp. NPDC090010 TaxID=3363942 RepID=UPI00382EC8E9